MTSKRLRHRLLLLSLCFVAFSFGAVARAQAPPTAPPNAVPASPQAGRTTGPRASAQRRQPASSRRSAERVVRTPASFTAMRQGIAAAQQHGEQWNYHGAYMYWLEQRAYPRGGVDWNSYARAFTRRARMSSVRFIKRIGEAPPSPRWDFIGPKNLPVPYRQYYGEGTVSGRVNGIAYDPNRPEVIYLASAGGGFWRSSDAGQTWSCLSDRWENVKFSSVAVHPTNSNIIIVGTGDYDGALGYGFGLMMTTDGGATWSNLLRSELRWYSVSQILFDPDNPSIITVTAGRHPQNRGRIMRSADGGETWAPVITQMGTRIDWSDVQVSARETDGRRYYYAVGVLSNGLLPRGVRNDLLRCAPAQLWRSRDRGATWQPLAGPTAGNCMQNVNVATSPTSPGTVYLATRDYNYASGQVWKGTQAGARWDDVTTQTFPHHADTQKQDYYNWSQAGYDFYIGCASHPLTGKDVIYVGLIDVVASTDGGATWKSVGRSYTPDARTHNDQHALAFNPRDPNDLLVGNDGGIYRLKFKPSTNPAEDDWEFESQLNAGLGMTMFYRIAVTPAEDPADPDWVVGGTQDNATPVSMGDTDRWVNMGGGDGGFCAINPQDPKMQYVTSQNLHIQRTGDGWASSADITHYEYVSFGGQPPERVSWGGDRRGFIAPITLSPQDPKRLYVGTQYLWRWDDDLGQWSGRLGNQVLASGDGYVNYIAVAPSDGQRIYTGSNVGDLWMTADGGATWERIDNLGLPGAGATPALPVTSIAVHPTNPDSILVGYGSTEAFAHLWGCNDTSAGERRWTALGGAGMGALPSIPLNAIAIDPLAPDSTYYVATDVGVFLSNDRGATWANFGTPLGLPNVQVTDLHITPGSRRLVAATFGRGAWRIVLPEGAQPLYAKPAAVPGLRGARRPRR